ncbi:lysophospholipid acyltransferase family protein [Deinococcus aquiradiocola]|uniref:1-acyl-sn-glycerol-3-phosphate acyltransferase n=1 Tax=Deinococcus aquiradiocola TaxID=393059 RepID=A0A917P3X6_9DEIO|nr:lysophospholipid acyltransferase family protein [Deinococcus aquiradiocola]GGJ60458.1 1-acyl-sn-glycerol-3-phosphate acyltransferase [Deinococcus aquiradiocola]
MTDAKPANAAPRLIPFMYHLVVNTTRLPLLLRGQRVVALGRELIPATGRLVIAGGNHTSNMDPFIIAQTLPEGRRVQFMAKKELFKGPVGWIISGGGSFPVDRKKNDLGAIRNALRVLQAEGTLGIFPEGTRGGQELQGGTALLALKGKAPITPVWLNLKGRTWIVRFGEPIQPTGSVRELTERLDAAFDALDAQS